MYSHGGGQRQASTAGRHEKNNGNSSSSNRQGRAETGRQGPDEVRVHAGPRQALWLTHKHQATCAYETAWRRRSLAATRARRVVRRTPANAPPACLPACLCTGCAASANWCLVVQRVACRAGGRNMHGRTADRSMFVHSCSHLSHPSSVHTCSCTCQGRVVHSRANPSLGGTIPYNARMQLIKPQFDITAMRIGRKGIARPAERCRLGV
ncbi:unnamed protein product [Periconia digitata]|uniref:Uncharacterized protein n=1 Tax=Periconia digitata TaxID=1303443 RepID=A0A9W4U501_9PLEO|nr:unnamed protein product [Periconia digitata]